MKWPEVSLSKVAEVITGNTPPKKDPDNYGQGIPWVKPPDLDAWEPVTETIDSLSPKGQKSARLLPEGTVMVCCIGSIGRVGIAGTTLATNQQINSLVFGSQVDNKFGYYYCRSISNVFKTAASKAIVPILNKSNFSKIRIPLPPLSEQRRIVEILDQADRLRKLRAEADKKAERILPALFIKMFGDPATNPMGWPVYEFSEITEFVTDGTHQSPTFSESGIPFLFVQNIVSGIIDFDTKKFISHETYEILTKNRKPQRGDILYSTVGSYGVAVLVETDRLFSFQRHIGHIRCIEDLVDPYFLCVQMNTPFIKMQADQRARGIAQKTVNLSEIKQFKAVIPSIDKQQEFISLAKDTLVKRDMQRQQTDKLAELFNVLLHRAFIGDLTASWRESHMKELLQEMELQAKALAS